MSTDHTRLWWVSLGLAAVFPLAAFSLNRWSHARTSSIHVSSAQLNVILGRNSTEFSGPGPLHIPEALTNRRHLEQQGQLLLGQKVYRLLTTNASLAELAVGFAHYANCKVMVPGEPEEAFAARFGAFDSANYPTRGKAAQGIARLLNDAGWHVARLTDGKAVFVSEAEYRILVARTPMFSPPPALPEPHEPLPSSSTTRTGDTNTGYE